MHLHCRFCDAHVAGNLFVEATGRHLGHDLALAGAESVETLLERTQGLISLPTGSVAGKAGLDSVEAILVTERFCDEFYGPLIACTVIGMSPCAVMKMIGTCRFAAARSR
jgi:hypothetical protein